MRFVIAPEGENLRVRGSYLGFEATFEIGPEGVLQTLQDLVGSSPFEIRIHDRGTNAQEPDQRDQSRRDSRSSATLP